LYLTQKQQELPIEFNLVMYYTIGNITGNVTDSVTDFAIYGKLHLPGLFKGGAQII